MMMMYCIVSYTGHLLVRIPRILMNKAFHPTLEDLQPHALGGSCYRHIWALQPQTHMSIN